ncbi:MAG: hypothetical protein ACTHLZ_12080 [Tepidisphaeraceae bacterium]
MQLTDALDQLDEIRRFVFRAATFRGFRSSTTLFTALVAAATALAQGLLLPHPEYHLRAFTALWAICALISGGLVVAGAVARLRRYRSPVENHQALAVLEMLMPSLAIGGLMTLAAIWLRPTLTPFLPAWWMILTSMGVFALRRWVGRVVVIPAAFYGVCGLLALLAVQPLSPWWMGGVFGVGQTIAAAALRFTVERDHGA